MSISQTNAVTQEGFHSLIHKLQARQAVVAVVGLGFVGLPEAIAVAGSGLKVIGLEIDDRKVATIKNGHSSDNGADGSRLKWLLDKGYLHVTTDASDISKADCAIMCVPSPLTEEHEPDLSYIKAAATTIARNMGNPKLVVIESTCPPGTTRRVVLPILEAAGGRVGRDFFLASAPERIDPANKKYNIKNTPRLVAGVTERCTECAAALYSGIIDNIKVVSSVEVAEMTKIAENTFRFINISFVNELATLCDSLGISVWEVIDAAATKPFSFMAHQPGPGVGGACIPVVPFHLRPLTRETGVSLDLIEAAGRVNARMPQFVVDKLERLLAKQGKAPHNANILVLGITYKPDVPDLREAPALKVIELLLNKRARVSYHDPFIDEVTVAGETLASRPLTVANLSTADGVLLLTPHSHVDYDLVVKWAHVVFDTRNHLATMNNQNIVRL